MLKFCMCCRCLRGDGDSHLTVVMSVDQQIIKRSIAYRAKYRLSQSDAPTYRVVAPLLVVPHPKNRQVTSLRTKELIGTIVKDTCDEVEANSSAVAASIFTVVERCGVLLHWFTTETCSVRACSLGCLNLSCIHGSGVRSCSAGN